MMIFREPIELGPWLSVALVVATIMVTNLCMLPILQKLSNSLASPLHYRNR